MPRAKKPDKPADKAPVPAKVTPPKDAGEKLVEWIQAHRRGVLAGAAIVVAVAVGGWFTIEYRQNKEEAAARALEQARFASQSGNFPLAANDLSRLISQFGGTRAADEGVILLAQVRLLQDQPHLAAEELRGSVSGLAAQFQAPAYGLLGTALENAGQMEGAAQAYEDAARSSWYDGVRAQYLSDAGRAWWSARDTNRAVAAYQRLLDEFPDAANAMEARVRLAELEAVRSGSSPQT